LKAEWVRTARLNKKVEAKEKLFEDIEVFCNRKRLRSTLGCKSPAGFEGTTTPDSIFH
jgi:hypothetical protein